MAKVAISSEDENEIEGGEVEPPNEISFNFFSKIIVEIKYISSPTDFCAKFLAITEKIALG